MSIEFELKASRRHTQPSSHDAKTLASVFAGIAPAPRVPCFRFLDASSRLINSRESAAFFRCSSCRSLRAAWGIFAEQLTVRRDEVESQSFGVSLMYASCARCDTIRIFLRNCRQTDVLAPVLHVIPEIGRNQRWQSQVLRFSDSASEKNSV